MRHQRGEPAISRVDAAPMRRDVALELATRAADQPVEVLPQQQKLRGAARGDAILAFETKTDAVVEQLQQVDVDAGILLELRQQVEEPVAAPGFAEERADQAACRPHAAAAPGCVE